jgi:hypothetical protein
MRKSKNFQPKSKSTGNYLRRNLLNWWTCKTIKKSTRKLTDSTSVELIKYQIMVFTILPYRILQAWQDKNNKWKILTELTLPMTCILTQKIWHLFIRNNLRCMAKDREVKMKIHKEIWKGEFVQLTPLELKAWRICMSYEDILDRIFRQPGARMPVWRGLQIFLKDSQ